MRKVIAITAVLFSFFVKNVVLIDEDKNNNKNNDTVSDIL